MQDERTEKILEEILLHYRNSDQIDMMIEESAELIVAINKWKRARKASLEECKTKRDEIIGEMADVQIMLWQMEMIFGSPAEQIEFKLNRMVERLGLDM